VFIALTAAIAPRSKEGDLSSAPGGSLAGGTRISLRRTLRAS